MLYYMVMSLNVPEFLTFFSEKLVILGGLYDHKLLLVTPHCHAVIMCRNNF